MANITLAELDNLRQQGAEIQREKREIVVDGFKELFEQITMLARAREQEENKRNSDLLQAINQLTTAVMEKREEPEEDNLRPLLARIIELQSQLMIVPEKPDYSLDVKRNSRNLITQVVARPIQGTLN